MKKRELTVGIVRGEIVIRIGIDTLKVATELSPSMPEGSRVTNISEWARSVVSKLEDEEEDGTTLVHRMFDSAFEAAMDDGEEGINFAEEDDDEDSEGQQMIDREIAGY